MSYDKKLLPAALLLVGLYILYVQKFETALATYGIGLLIFVVTDSKELVLAFFAASIFIKPLNRIFSSLWKTDPVGIEAFQARDAPSITARLESVKQDGPLKPKVDQKAPILPLFKQTIEPGAITGVLESPSILDNSPLQGIASLGKEGVPGVSIPASAKARALIYPPAETSVPPVRESMDNPPMNNPYLQNGPDMEGVNGALIDRGTDMLGGTPGYEMEGMTTDSPPF
jgi:hypothetical protein